MSQQQQEPKKLRIPYQQQTTIKSNQNRDSRHNSIEIASNQKHMTMGEKMASRQQSASKTHFAQKQQTIQSLYYAGRHAGQDQFFNYQQMATEPSGGMQQTRLMQENLTMMKTRNISRENHQTQAIAGMGQKQYSKSSQRTPNPTTKKYGGPFGGFQGSLHDSQGFMNTQLPDGGQSVHTTQPSPSQTIGNPGAAGNSQLHIINQTGVNINSILQSSQLQQILQSQASQNKQQIIIVQSGGSTSQALTQLLQNQGQQVNGGTSSISLSGVSLNQLQQILSQINNQQPKPAQLDSFKIQQAPVQPLLYGQLSIQQQIQQLQAQNQLVQQQILNNVLQGSSNSLALQNSMSQMSNQFSDPQNTDHFLKILSLLLVQQQQEQQMSFSQNQQTKQQIQQIQHLQNQINNLQLLQRQHILANPPIDQTQYAGMGMNIPNQINQMLLENSLLNTASMSKNKNQLSSELSSLHKTRTSNQNHRSVKKQNASTGLGLNEIRSNVRVSGGISEMEARSVSTQKMNKKLKKQNLNQDSILEAEVIDLIKQPKSAEKPPKRRPVQNISSDPNQLSSIKKKNKYKKNDESEGNSPQTRRIESHSRHFNSATMRTEKVTKEQYNTQANGFPKDIKSPPAIGARAAFKPNGGISPTQKDKAKTTKKVTNSKTFDLIQTAPVSKIEENYNDSGFSDALRRGKTDINIQIKDLVKTTEQQKKDKLKAQNSAMLELPRQFLLPADDKPPALTKQEKKRIQQEKERKREKELFEKNFKPSSLYINKMALHNLKSFINKPSAIVVYHQHRQVKLDIDSPSDQQPVHQPSAVAAVPNLQKLSLNTLITPEELSEFYNHSIKRFHLAGRNLEVVEEPNYIFKKEQMEIDPQLHSIQERKIKESLDVQLKEKADLMKPENLAANPIVFPSGNIKDTTVFFNSRFESGNLREVEKISEFEYNLFVSFDFNSSVHSQWYFFSVRNIGKNKQYKINICNLQKDESCYQIGMKPFVYSTKRNREQGTNVWRRGCDNVCYYKNKHFTKARECAPDYEFDEDNIACYEYEDETSKAVNLNTLSFCYEFEHENDIVYFAYFQPYTLNDLEDYLFSIKKNFETEHLQNIFKCEKMCQTLGGNPCYVLTITDNVKEDDCIKLEGDSVKIKRRDSMEYDTQRGMANQIKNALSNQKPKEDGPDDGMSDDGAVLSGFQMAAKNQTDFDQKQKSTVFLTARVHPGESNASFMMQGVIEFLLQSNNKEAKQLRETFIFKIIPILNPDGVADGCYRCNFIGADLNRRWLNPSKLLHPTIYFTKKLLRMCHQHNQVLLFCDFHGHTRKRNVFMYGCVSSQSEINQHKNNNLIRVMPYLLDQKNKHFSFADCKFGNERDKESTGRMVMFKEFGILNSYTIEATFYSCYNPKQGVKKKVNVEDDLQIKVEDLYSVGWDFCDTLMVIINSKILKRKFIVDTTLPIGQMQPGVGGNPMTNFFMNQQNEALNQQKTHQSNSIQYCIDNNVQSTLKQFINGGSMNPYHLFGGGIKMDLGGNLNPNLDKRQNTQSPEKIKRNSKRFVNESTPQNFNSGMSKVQESELPSRKISSENQSLLVLRSSQNAFSIKPIKKLSSRNLDDDALTTSNRNAQTMKREQEEAKLSHQAQIQIQKLKTRLNKIQNKNSTEGDLSRSLKTSIQEGSTDKKSTISIKDEQILEDHSSINKEQIRIQHNTFDIKAGMQESFNDAILLQNEEIMGPEQLTIIDQYMNMNTSSQHHKTKSSIMVQESLIDQLGSETIHQEPLSKMKIVKKMKSFNNISSNASLPMSQMDERTLSKDSFSAYANIAKIKKVGKAGTPISTQIPVQISGTSYTGNQTNKAYTAQVTGFALNSQINSAIKLQPNFQHQNMGQHPNDLLTNNGFLNISESLIQSEKKQKSDIMMNFGLANPQMTKNIKINNSAGPKQNSSKIDQAMKSQTHQLPVDQYNHFLNCQAQVQNFIPIQNQSMLENKDPTPLYQKQHLSTSIRKNEQIKGTVSNFNQQRSSYQQKQSNVIFEGSLPMQGSLVTQTPFKRKLVDSHNRFGSNMRMPGVTEDLEESKNSSNVLPVINQKDPSGQRGSHNIGKERPVSTHKQAEQNPHRNFNLLSNIYQPPYTINSNIQSQNIIHQALANEQSKSSSQPGNNTSSPLKRRYDAIQFRDNTQNVKR